MAENETGRVACHHCSTRYRTDNLQPGQIFSCDRCGELIRAPGATREDKTNILEQAFGDTALDMGLLTPVQLTAALEKQKKTPSRSVRLPDVLLELGYLNYDQLRNVLQKQEAPTLDYIPGYEIVRDLGRGGMGAVYKGMHLASGKTVAIKVLAPGLVGNGVFLERFHREAKVAIKLDHPNIVKGYDEGSIGDVHYFVMEYVHGKSAGRVLKKRGKFGERRAFDIIRQITLALEYAHARGIVHRDIKPDNIMMTREGKARLADYGLVKFADDLSMAALTSEGQIMGTPHYISPEQAAGESDIDIRSDIYSLGATLFHMLTGRPPFVDKKLAAVLRHHRQTPLPHPREFRPDLSDAACVIAQKMLEKDRDDRYQTPQELEEAMASYFRGSTLYMADEELLADAVGEVDPTPMRVEPTTGSFTAEPDTPPAMPPTHPSIHQRPWLAILVGVLCALVLLAVFAVYLLHQKKRRQAGDEPAPAVTAPDTPAIPAPSVAPEPGEDTQVPLAESVDDPANVPVEEPAAPVEPEVEQVSGDESMAADLYREALLASGPERRAILVQVTQKYGHTASGNLAQQELDKILAEERRRAQVEEMNRKMQREREAQSALGEALARAATDEKQCLAALLAVAEKYKDTPAAKKAREEHDSLKARLEQLTKLDQEKTRLDKRSEQVQKRLEVEERLQPVRGKFLSLYGPAMLRLDLNDAARYAEFLAADERYPELQPMGKACLADVGDMRILFKAVERYLNGRKNSPELLTLAFASGRTMDVAVVNVEDGVMNLLVNGKAPVSRSLLELPDAELLRLYAQGRIGEEPGEKLMELLLSLARQKPETSTLLKALGKDDPRSGHHAQMIRWLEFR